jgi:hypothetical protein
MLLDLLKFHRVEVFTNTSLLEVTKNGVLLLDEDSQRKISRRYNCSGIGLET